MATTMRSLSPAPTTRISVGSFQDISNGFVAANTAAPNHLEWGEWSVGAPTSFSYEIGSSAFGTDIGSGTVAQNAGNSYLLFTNGLGYGVYDVTVPVSGSTMTAGGTYWVSISNATDAGNDGTQAWDIPNGGQRRSCDLQLPAERHQLWQLRSRRGILHAQRHQPPRPARP